MINKKFSGSRFARGRFSRTARLLGEDAMDRLARAHVLLFGVGGVGGYVCEVLVRSGVGEITLVDPDTVAESNINRQIIATDATVGMPKVQAAAERIRLINPDCIVHVRQEFYLPESGDSYDFSAYDYVIDAIDTVTAKL
ncbi:MAG: ThiF family adenylyltransferase, partial [Clostridia bacterium]|nr:ThiF family adenylyltransferase [Clostridia bacterium]